jgi:hypothetical protein
MFCLYVLNQSSDFQKLNLFIFTFSIMFFFTITLFDVKKKGDYETIIDLKVSNYYLKFFFFFNKKIILSRKKKIFTK